MLLFKSLLKSKKEESKENKLVTPSAGPDEPLGPSNGSDLSGASSPEGSRGKPEEVEGGDEPPIKKLKEEKSLSEKKVIKGTTTATLNKKKEFVSKSINTSPMVKIMEETQMPPSIGDMAEGPVLGIERSALYIDLNPFGTGIIYGREFINVRDVIKKINIGDTIAAKVVETENDEGYIELSLKEARQALVWSEAEEAVKNKSVFELPVKDANKGGLMIEWNGIMGFLPASQLKAEHYPRVEGGNKERVFTELQKFIGTKLNVCILSIIPKDGKLIFSEKEPEKKKKNEIAEKYAVGDIVSGEITGIVDFGLFVKIEDQLEGLVHISEMDWGLVNDPHTLFKVGSEIKAQIIEIKDGKISLSVKALKENPWVKAGKKYKKGDKVTGVVIKYNKHGALMSIEEGIAGLVHISEFGDDEKLKEGLELGKSYTVTITLFEPKELKMTLSYKAKETEEKQQNEEEQKVEESADKDKK